MTAEAHNRHDGRRLILAGILIPNTDGQSLYTCTQTLQIVSPAVIVRTKYTDSFVCPCCRGIHHIPSPEGWHRGGRGPLPLPPGTPPPAPPIVDEPPRTRKGSFFRRLAALVRG